MHARVRGDISCTGAASVPVATGLAATEAIFQKGGACILQQVVLVAEPQHVSLEDPHFDRTDIVWLAQERCMEVLSLVLTWKDCTRPVRNLGRPSSVGGACICRSGLLRCTFHIPGGG